MRRQVRGADPGDALPAAFVLAAGAANAECAKRADAHLAAGALKQPLEAAEWQTIVDFASRSWQVTPRTTLSPAQIPALLNKVFVLRVARAQETLAIPQEEPVARRTWSAKPWQLALGAVVLLLVLWLLL